MPQHVAMQKPFARIVEDTNDVAALLALQKRGVAQWAKGAVLLYLVEMVTMQSR